MCALVGGKDRMSPAVRAGIKKEAANSQPE